MTILDWIARCNTFDASEFRPLLCAGNHIGWVHNRHVESQFADDSVFLVADDAIHLHAGLCSPEARTSALESVTARWFADGLIAGWRGEHYRAATALDAPILFSVERAAAPYFGLRAWGVHVNGFVRKDGELYMWVAKRAENRPVAAGKWDHIIAGGQPADLGVRENLIKEAAEEAGMPADIANQAKAAGQVSYCFADPYGRLRPDTLLVFDLELPPEFIPRNADGEVDRFELWPIARVHQAICETQTFKTNCNLVIIDFLVRHGVLAPDETVGYEAIVRGLRQDFPAIEASRQRMPRSRPIC